MQAQNVVFDATIGTNATLRELNNARTPMLMALDAEGTPAPQADAILTLDNLENITVTGSNLTINLAMDFGTLKQMAENYNLVGITLNEGSDFAGVDNVTVSCNGTALTNTFRSDDRGTVFFDATVVPEPATATLSLLALAALAARRKRK